MPRLCEFYPGICLTTEEKAWKNLSQGKKNLSQVKKHLRESTVVLEVFVLHPSLAFRGGLGSKIPRERENPQIIDCPPKHNFSITLVETF